jgi:septin family protein
MAQQEFASEAEWNETDSRIHCLFYFIPSHRMKDIDTEFIERLSPIVPIVPIIAKADMMTVEVSKFNIRVTHSYYCFFALWKFTIFI